MALVDGDPSGLSILSTYVNGSTAMQHERDKLAAGERIKWVGVWLSELSRWAIMLVFSSKGIQQIIRFDIDKDSLLPITNHDEKMVFLGVLSRKQGTNAI